MNKKTTAIKIVVDTNIVFSGLLNSSGKIGKILTHSRQHFDLYTCSFLRTELLKHRSRLIKLTKITTNELDELESLITSHITFINESLIPEKTIIAAEQLLSDIDKDDAPFVALANHLKAKLWTGDMKLYRGLSGKKIKTIITTAELSRLLDKLEKR